MDYLIITSVQHVGQFQTLSAHRLVLKASQEEQVRQQQAEAERRRKQKDKKRARAASGVAAGGGRLRISGKLLRQLCLEEFQKKSSTADKDFPTDCARLSCVIANTDETLRAGFRIISSGDLPEYLFDLQSELLMRNQVVLFTIWDTLEQLALPERQHQLLLQTQGQRSMVANSEVSDAGIASVELSAINPDSNGQVISPGRPARRFVGLEEIKEDLIGDSFSSSATSSRLVSSHGATWQFMESFFEAVPAAVGSEDVKDINELLDDGILNVDKHWMTFLCARCLHIPLLTLTMSCCGTLLCPQCLPSPPTVDGVRPEERLCPVCGEEPLEPPQSHPQRDQQVGHLVRELKVLYWPQLRTRRQRRGSPDYKPRGAFLADTSPVLGPF